MFGPKNWLVIMISGNSLQLIGQGENDVQTIPLPTTIINNMEVINKDGLYTLITDWTKQRTYANTSIVWLLAPDICFEHLITGTETNQIDSELVQFLDTVPFEEVVSHIYPSSDSKLIVAVNKNLIMAFIQGFSLHGYVTKVVVPNRLVQAETTLTPEIANSSIKRMGELIKDSLTSSVLPPITSSISPLATPAPAKAKSKSSLPLLLSVFGVLLAILLAVIFLTK